MDNLDVGRLSIENEALLHATSPVTMEGAISPIVNKQKPRKIHLYKKADWDGFKEFIQGFSDEIVIENLFPGKKVKMKMMLNHSSKPLKANCTLESTNSFHLNCYKEKFVSMDRCRSQQIDQEKK